MTKLHLIKRSLLTLILATCISTGLGPIYAAYAQSNETAETVSPSSRLAFGGGFATGILPPAGHDGIGNYFSGRTSYGISLRSAPDQPDRTDQFWLELDSNTNNQQGISAQIGLGYSPTPDVGFAVGPFLDLNAATTDNIGIYQTGGLAIEQPRQRALISGNHNAFNDAGLAASLSYMPLEDIWIGLHGSVSHSLTPTPPDQGILDGIDAMLGLTARYRIEF
ncbi:MAG: hypothetical protein RIB30_14130 [Thalassospira sp.]|uniref:hypothetical protein n=1 Tax=Thalassospira sp. TaxID=1912094 RepID=UPI0032F04813